jgi:hypothetical protein
MYILAPEVIIGILGYVVSGTIWYGVSVSQMTTEMFRLSLSQSGPFLIHDLSPGL